MLRFGSCPTIFFSRRVCGALGPPPHHHFFTILRDLEVSAPLVDLGHSFYHLPLRMQRLRPRTLFWIANLRLVSVFEGQVSSFLLEASALCFLPRGGRLCLFVFSAPHLLVWNRNSLVGRQRAYGTGCSGCSPGNTSWKAPSPAAPAAQFERQALMSPPPRGDLPALWYGMLRPSTWTVFSVLLRSSSVFPRVISFSSWTRPPSRGSIEALGVPTCPSSDEWCAVVFSFSCRYSLVVGDLVGICVTNPSI